MESARDKRTGKIVEAEDLWLLDDNRIQCLHLSRGI